MSLVSIPQGVDVKRWYYSGLFRWCMCINPTRGGRQTRRKSLMRPNNHSYQSHKGWTSNSICSSSLLFVMLVSIPQGVDVKPVINTFIDMASQGINPTRGGRQTFCAVPRPPRIKLYQSHKGWTSNKAHQARHRSS